MPAITPADAAAAGAAGGAAATARSADQERAKRRPAVRATMSIKFSTTPKTRTKGARARRKAAYA